MTDSGNSQPQDDSDEDIYKNIPEFNLEEELAKLEGSKEIYKQEASDLTKKVKALLQENKELKKLNEVLKKNLSTLLKTAQAEVQRKDSVIEELRFKVESFAFRRHKKSTSDKFTSTDDFIRNPSCKQDFVKQKSSSEKKRSKSFEEQTNIDSDWPCNQNNERKTILQSGKEENSNCGKKKSDYQKRKSSRYEDSSGHRRPFRENDRDHLLYDSYDKKRHSRSSYNRFLSRRRSSRERRHDLRRSESWERRKKSHRRNDSSERSRREGSKKEKSRSRESKESSLEKSRLSRDNELVAWIKEEVEARPEVSKNGKGSDSKRRTDSIEKKRNTEESVVGNGKNKQNNEKVSDGSDKRKNVETFSAKSPLDALHNDMVASRRLSQSSTSKGGTGTVQCESGPEPFESGNEFQNRSPVKENWTLSFKNERQNETKPMTLYSRRMMQKLSSESKEKHLKKSTERKEAKEKTDRPTEGNSMEQFTQPEKEPGELSDDGSVTESGEAFQELTEVALESEMIKSPKESFVVTSMMTVEPSPKVVEVEKLIACKDIESKKDICDAIEFSPFKNNYKLIEISPMKPPGNGHILEFYSKKGPPRNLAERSRAVDSSEEKTGHEKLPDTSGEEDSWRNSSSDNNMGSELEMVTSSLRGSSKEEETLERKEKEPEKNEEKELTKKRETKSIASKEKTSFIRGKRRESLKKATQKLAPDKRRRKFDDEAEGKSDSKKLKLEKSELPRKSTRSKTNPKSRSESQPRQELENRINEDYSSCEFFNPMPGTEVPETPADFAINKCPLTDYKIAATMSVTGVVSLETPNKCMPKLKNLMINEQMMLNILDSKNSCQFSPLIGPESSEMTPGRMLKNDLMLTDSEDDSLSKRNAAGEDIDEAEGKLEEEANGNGFSGSECSNCGSDSGASNFVDLL